MYHMNIPEHHVLMMGQDRRKWMMQRFVEQKRKENEEIDKAKSKAKSKGK